MPSTSRLTQIRARLALPVVRRATGLLEGRHRSVFRGHGQDFDDLHQYTPGEDVGDIDWRASARAGTPVVKRYIATSNITLVLVVDTGRHMAATAASGEPKAEVAAYAATVLAHLGQVRGDRVSLVAGDSGRLRRMPARAGSEHLEVLLRTVERSFDPDAPAGNLARLLDHVLRTTRRRSLVAVVTDEARPTADDARALARVRDVETGRTLPAYLRGRRRLGEAIAQARVERHEATTARLRSLGVEHVVVEGTDDTVDEVVALLARMRRAGR